MSAALQHEMVQKLSRVLGWDVGVVEGVVEAVMGASTKKEVDSIVEVGILIKFVNLQVAPSLTSCYSSRACSCTTLASVFALQRALLMGCRTTWETPRGPRRLSTSTGGHIDVLK